MDERFQEGERVRIWDQHSTLHGRVGTVVQADEQRYQYVVVLVDGAELPQWWPCEKLRRVDEDLALVMRYTGWSREIAEAAIRQWKEQDPDWSAEYIAEYL